jgi:ABC-type antimicrobial peptide transport system permease subunit
MDIKTLLKLSVRNLFRHKVKNILVVLMIVTGCVLFFIASSLEKNIRDNWRNYLSKTVTGDYYITSITGIGDSYTFFNPVLPSKFINKELFDFLDRNNMQYSRRIRIGAKFFDERYGFGGFNKFLGVDFAKEEKLLSNIRIFEGSFDPKAKNGIDIYVDSSWKNQIKIGTDFVFFFRAADGGTVPYKFIVNGKFDLNEKLNNNYFRHDWVLVKSSYLSEILRLNPDDFTDVVIWDSAEKYKENLKALAMRYGLKLMNSEETIGSGTSGVIGFVRFIEFAVVIFIIIIFLISVTNLNLMSFFERKREFAAMLAMGFRPLKLQLLLVTEIVLFSLIAFLIACGFFIILSFVFLNGIRLDFIQSVLAGRNFFLCLMPTSLVVAFVFVFVTVLVSMAYPVILIEKIEPIEVFRNES